MVKKKNDIFYGLVLSGGRSTRMGKDKALIKFHGKSQLAYGVEILSGFCDQVFLSIRKDQAKQKGYQGFQHIYDTHPFQNIGPLGGILSAMGKYPGISWIVIGCDLPFINSKTIQYLIKKRDVRKKTTAYQSSHDNLPEPLCAIYEPQARKAMIAYFKKGGECPRKFLIQSDVRLLKQQNKSSLENINYPEEYKEAMKRIH